MTGSALSRVVLVLCVGISTTMCKKQTAAVVKDEDPAPAGDANLVPVDQVSIETLIRALEQRFEQDAKDAPASSEGSPSGGSSTEGGTTAAAGTTTGAAPSSDTPTPPEATPEGDTGLRLTGEGALVAGSALQKFNSLYTVYRTFSAGLSATSVERRWGANGRGNSVQWNPDSFPRKAFETLNGVRPLLDPARDADLSAESDRLIRKMAQLRDFAENGQASSGGRTGVNKLSGLVPFGIVRAYSSIDEWRNECTSFEQGLGAYLDRVNARLSGTQGQAGDAVLFANRASLDKYRWYCLDQSSTRATLIYAHPCHGGGNQRFIFNANDGSFKVSGTGACLDVSGKSQGGGYEVYANPTCFGNVNQTWSLDAQGRVVSAMRIRGKTLCLDLDPGTRDPNGHTGFRVYAFECHDGPNQNWRREVDYSRLQSDEQL